MYTLNSFKNILCSPIHYSIVHCQQSLSIFGCMWWSQVLSWSYMLPKSLKPPQSPQSHIYTSSPLGHILSLSSTSCGLFSLPLHCSIHWHTHGTDVTWAHCIQGGLQTAWPPSIFLSFRISQVGSDAILQCLFIRHIYVYS